MLGFVSSLNLHKHCRHLHLMYLIVCIYTCTAYINTVVVYAPYDTGECYSQLITYLHVGYHNAK